METKSMENSMNHEGMNSKEKFLFDLQGYLVLEDVLSPEEVAAANQAVEAQEHLIAPRPAGLAQGATRLVGQEGRGEFGQNPLSFERPHCEPFRRMLTHPRTIAVFNEILGTGFRLDHGPGLIQMRRGTEGHRLHGGMTFDPSQYHGFTHGKMHCGLCVAAWQLTDARPGDGGFACIPGSHKANYRPAAEVLRLEEDWGCVEQVVAPAGAVVIFNEALIHGTLPWQPESRLRRSILFKFSPGFMAWGTPQAAPPMSDPTPEEAALYEKPRRTGRTALGEA
jgi:ectoine hydroxylase-related dioxygenase (phytanoyl-CoA dioxygenase family)